MKNRIDSLEKRIATRERHFDALKSRVDRLRSLPPSRIDTSQNRIIVPEGRSETFEIRTDCDPEHADSFFSVPELDTRPKLSIKRISDWDKDDGRLGRKQWEIQISGNLQA